MSCWSPEGEVTREADIETALQLSDAFGQDEATRRLDHREMRERLREVAEVVTGLGVELLGVETERRRDADQSLQQVTRALLLADDGEGRDQPERADQERALLARQSVVGLVGAVAQDESVFGQIVGDRE